MTDPKQIWLSPRCHDERTWCDDDPWEKCEDCGAESVRYVLASDSDARIAELEGLLRDAKQFTWDLKNPGELRIRIDDALIKEPSHG